MRLGSYLTLPNPSEIARESARLIAAQLTYGGIRTQIITRYYASANPNPGTTPQASIAVQYVKLAWDGLTVLEAESLRLACLAASHEYVLMTCPGLRLTYNNVADSAMVIVNPKEKGIQLEGSQGFSDTGAGPLLFNAQAIFNVQTYFE